MFSKFRLSLLEAAFCALVYASASSLHAGTIIKLNLGNIGPDLSMNSDGFLSTYVDSDDVTPGDQNTNIEYTDFLEPIPDVATSIASFTLSNLDTSGAPVVSGPLVFQNFTGGTFSLYDPSGLLLLSGSLSTSSLFGTVGPPGGGAVFSTGSASVTGGVLADFIVTESLGLSMTLSNTNGGAGLFLGNGPILNAFLADSVVSISGSPTTTGEGLPEPGTIALALVALFATAAVRRRDQ